MDYYHTGIVNITCELTHRLRDGIEMSKWCKDKGLVYYVDYRWRQTLSGVEFPFKDPKWATLMSLSFDLCRGKNEII